MNIAVHGAYMARVGACNFRLARAGTKARRLRVDGGKGG